MERLGGNERIRLDVRVIAATNSNLAGRVRDGLFRQDLYYRLNVFRIELTPLRDRVADIPVSARHFVAKFCALEGVSRKCLDDSAMDRLLAHNWPGNVRELENVMEAAVVLSASRQSITADDVRLTGGAGTAEKGARPGQTSAPGSALIPGMTIPLDGLDYQEALHAFEHSLLTQAIARTRGNKTAAADLLRLKRTTLSARMRAAPVKVAETSCLRGARFPLSIGVAQCFNVGRPARPSPRIAPPVTANFRRLRKRKGPGSQSRSGARHSWRGRVSGPPCPAKSRNVLIGSPGHAARA